MKLLSKICSFIHKDDAAPVNKHVYTIRFQHEDSSINLSLSPREQHRIKFRFTTSDFASFHDEVLFQARILLEYIAHINALPANFCATHKLESLIQSDSARGIVPVTASNYKRLRDLIISVNQIPDPEIFFELENAENMPTRGSKFAAGLDLKANEDLVLNPGCRAAVSTGVKAACPTRSYLRIAPRSGLAVKHGIDVMAGVVDSDYRGEIKVCLINHGQEAFHIAKGDRIAQAILTPIYIPEIRQVESLGKTCRGDGGFGSTGK